MGETYMHNKESLVCIIERWASLLHTLATFKKKPPICLATFKIAAGHGNAKTTDETLHQNPLKLIVLLFGRYNQFLLRCA